MDNWEERYDTTYGRLFYVNRGRRIAQLEDPRLESTCTHQYGKDRINVIDDNASLTDFSWYHGQLSRSKANKLLRGQLEGTFLIRDSKSCPGDFALSARCENYPGGVIHDRIVKTKQGFSVDDRFFFNSLQKLVQHFTTEYLPYIHGKLTVPLHKHDTERDTVGVDTIPDELENDPYTRGLYEKAIEEGTEEDNTLRIMIVGCFGQGKTSLVRRLLEQSIDGVETTDGIEVQQCIIASETEWMKLDYEDPEEESIQRLVNIATSNPYDDNAFQDKEIDTETFIKSVHNTDVKRAESGINEEMLSLYVTKVPTPDKSVSKPKVDIKYLKKFQTHLKRFSSRQSSAEEKDTKLHIWDFGGQFVYYATHQIFHAKQALYILVFNLAVGLDTIVQDDEFPLHKKTMGDYLKFWVNSVNSFVGSSDGYEPPIILVGTHKDKLPKDVNVQDYFEEIRKLFDGSLCLHHIQPDQFAVSNKDLLDQDIMQLRRYIYTLGTKRLQRSVPAKWILLEKVLKQEKAKKIITFEDILAIDNKNERPLQTDDSEETNNRIKLFLTYHHARGTFCYFDDDRLSQYVVLDPQFLIDAFRCIITSERFCKVRPRMRKHWNELCSTAVLRSELLEEVWKENADFIRFKDLLTEFLQKHRIISEVLTYDVDTESIRPQGYYIVPSFLKKSADDGVIETFCGGKNMSEVSLGYILENETMLPTIYQRCLSALVGKWPLVKFDGQFVVYDDVVACQLRPDHAGVLMSTQNRLELLVVNLCPPDGVSPEVCDMFRRYIEVSINTDMRKLRGLNEKGHLLKKTTVRCFHIDHGSKGSKDTYILDEIQSCERMPCPDKGSHCLLLKNILHEWFMHEIDFAKVPSRKLTNKEYSSLSMAIGHGWKQIGLQLGLDNVAIEHIEMNKETVDMKIFTMFLSWAKKEADRATLDELVYAIYRCPRQIVSVNWDVLKNIINGF